MLLGGARQRGDSEGNQEFNRAIAATASAPLPISLRTWLCLVEVEALRPRRTAFQRGKRDRIMRVQSIIWKHRAFARRFESAVPLLERCNRDVATFKRITISGRRYFKTDRLRVQSMAARSNRDQC